VRGSEEAEVRLEADGKEWGHVVGWGENPEHQLGDLSDLFDATEEQEWQERALCAQTDPEAFFPEKGGSTREAKRICLGCDVKDDCLEYALAHDERFGIWGGLSERERRKLKKRAV
jgi:WhiB family redox-sensing transcriptional regulator